MHVFDAVRTLLAVRSFQDKPVPPEITRKIVEAGRLSPSSMNAQPWHFIVVEERETLKRIGALAKSGPYIAQAPLAIAVAIADTPFAVSDASRAVQSMILTAWDEGGIGSNWAGFFGLEGVAKLLGVPSELKVLCVLPFGYPAQAVGRGRKNRKPPGEVASRNRFGVPFA